MESWEAAKRTDAIFIDAAIDASGVNPFPTWRIYTAPNKFLGCFCLAFTRGMQHEYHQGIRSVIEAIAICSLYPDTYLAVFLQY
jgi:hypothetical protein